jgi:riboflavin biosynthesis pyrimidine reductase
VDSSPALDLLLPAADARTIPADPAEELLSSLYAAPADRWVRANMITTLDGASAGADGRSGSINNAPDHRVFEVLRALADVVLVGAGTARTEGYLAARTPDRLLPGRRSRGQDDHPPLAVVTGRGNLPTALLDGEPTPWVFTTSDAPFLGHLRAHLPRGRLHVHDGAVDLRRVLDVLAEAGHGRVLTEGGPSLLGSLLAVDALDELCLTTSPLVVGGDASRAVTGAGWLDPALRARPAHLLHAEGVLLGRWMLRAD